MSTYARFLLTGLCLSIAMASSPAFACKTKKKKSDDEVSIRGGSGETTKERERRLKRECRGQVNAGACAGYTR